MRGFDPKDLLIRTFWTAVAAGLAYLGTEVAGLSVAWQPIATSALTLALVWVRQQAPPVDEMLNR